MHTLGSWSRVIIIVGAFVAALGSMVSNPPPQFGNQRPGSPCENACGQVARCNIAPYDGCLQECRNSGKEQQLGGPQELNLLARTGCAQLASMASQLAPPQHPQQPQPDPPPAYEPEPPAPEPSP